MPDTPAVALARILTEQDIASVEYAIAAVGSGLTGADLADLRAGWRQRDANTIIVALAASGYTLTPTPASGGSVDTGPGEQPSPSAVAEVSSPPDVTLGPGWDECASCGHYQSNHAALGCYITLCRCREFRLPDPTAERDALAAAVLDYHVASVDPRLLPSLHEKHRDAIALARRIVEGA